MPRNLFCFKVSTDKERLARTFRQLHFPILYKFIYLVFDLSDCMFLYLRERELKVYDSQT